MSALDKAEADPAMDADMSSINPGALGFSSRYCFEQEVSLVMQQEEPHTSEYMSICLRGSEEPLVNCEKSTKRFNKKLTFTAPEGQSLYRLDLPHFGWLRSWYLEESGSGKKLLRAREHLTLGTTEVDVRFFNLLDQGQETLMTIRRDFSSHQFLFVWNGTIVARATGDTKTLRREQNGLHSYDVDISPSVDVAMIAALLIGIDLNRPQHYHPPYEYQSSGGGRAGSGFCGPGGGPGGGSCGGGSCGAGACG